MQRMTPDYDHLPLMNKVEVFEHALEHTEGDDLVLLMAELVVSLSTC